MVNQDVFFITIFIIFASLEKRNSTKYFFLFGNYDFLHKCQYQYSEVFSWCHDFIFLFVIIGLILVFLWPNVIQSKRCSNKFGVISFHERYTNLFDGASCTISAPQHNGILLPKLFWPTVRKNCSSDREKLLIFEAEGQEFSKFLRWSLEQFIQTVKG